VGDTVVVNGVTEQVVEVGYVIPGVGSQTWQGLLTPVTAAHTSGTWPAVPGSLVKAGISGGSWTLQFPSAPQVNTIIGAKVMVNATGNANTLTVACQGSDTFEKAGGGTSVTLSLPLQAAAWQYNGGYWTRVSDDLPLGQLDLRYAAYGTGGVSLGADNTFTADQYFKSGRPWFDVIAFGADPTDTADSTLAFQTAINTALGLRTDTGVAMSGTSVTDPAAMSGDVGSYVNSTNYPNGCSHITAVTSSPVGYTVATGATSSLAGQVVAIGSGSSVTGRTALGPVYIPAGTYKITSDLLVRDVTGFRMTGAGQDQAKLRASGTNFTTALLHVDGSWWGTFEHFSITGDTTENLPSAIYQEWSPSSWTSTTGTTWNRVHLVSSNWVNGWNIAGGTPQNDTTEWHGCLASGGQGVGAWTNTGFWQNGIILGNGTYGNNYQHYMYNTAITGCYRGRSCLASSYWVIGGAGAANGTEFWFDGIANGMFSVTGYRCENAGLFIGGSATGLVECSLRDVTSAGSYLTGNYWFHLSGGCSTWLLENVAIYDVGQSGQVPTLAFNDSGSGIGPRVALINVNMRNSLASGVSLSNGGGGAVPTGVAINYVDNSTSPATTYPFWYYNGTSWVNALVQPGTVSTSGEIAITTATALTSAGLGLMHKCTVSAAYTVTLPTPVGYAGQQTGIRVAHSSTQLLTLATAAGLIDGASTRIMWAGESAMLESDGTNWVKIAGRTIPMQGVMALSAAQLIGTGTVTNVPLTETYIDNTALMCDPVTNQYITVQRPADYTVTARVAWAALAAVSNRTITVAYKNGSSSAPAAQDERYASTGGLPCIGATGVMAFAAGDHCTLSAYQSSGASLDANVGTPLYYGDGTLLSLTEIPAW
jgi:hypothetical protein